MTPAPDVQPATIDERLLNLIVKRTGGAREVFRKMKDDSQLDGWDNKQIFNASRKVYKKIRNAMNLPPDLILEELRDMGVIDKIDKDKLNRVLNHDPTAKELDPVFDAIVKRKSREELDKNMAELIQIKDKDPAKQEELLIRMAEIAKERLCLTQDKLMTKDDWLSGLDAIEELPESVPTGFSILDESIGGGFIKGNYHIISSPSGSGKTILMLSFWANLLKKGIKSVYINYEIPRDLFMKYLFAQLTGINVYKKNIDKNKLEKAKTEFKKTVLDLYEQDLLLISDPESGTSNMWMDLEDMIHDLVEIKGAECIWFDTINSINTKTKAGQSLRWNEYESIAMSAEFLCRELNVPIIFSAQMDRDIMKREEKSPKLGDVAGSKVLTEKAATIIHLHRTDLLDETKQIDYSELHITKNRVIGQEMGSKPIRVKYNDNYKRLYELPKNQQDTPKEITAEDMFDGTFINPQIPHPVLPYADNVSKKGEIKYLEREQKNA